MSMQSEGKDAKGRNYDQVTKDGGSSAGSLGADGTGGAGNMGAPRQTGNAQQARTDDLLSGGAADDAGSFTPSEEAGELQTGLGGIGSLSTGNAGNRQSEAETETGGKMNDTSQRSRGLPRQGVMPGEEMGHLHGQGATGRADKGSRGRG